MYKSTLHAHKNLATNTITLTFHFGPINYVSLINLDDSNIFSPTSTKVQQVHTEIKQASSVEIRVSDKHFPHTPKEVLYEIFLQEVAAKTWPLELKSFVCKELSLHFGFEYNVEPPTPKANLESMAQNLPGVGQMVEYPCQHEQRNVTRPLFNVIIHLNDMHEWSREQIADWLDELADSGLVDLDFPTPDGVDFDRDAVNGTKETK